jgi:hypothetical protein
MLSGIPVSMIRNLMILPPSVIYLKKTMKNNTLISMGSIRIILLLAITPVVKKSAMIHVRFLITRTTQMTNLTLFIQKLVVIFMEYINQKFSRSLLIFHLLHLLFGWALLIPSSAHLVLHLNMHMDEFKSPSSNTGIPDFPLAM